MRCHLRVKGLAEIDIRMIVAPMAALLSGTCTDPSVPIRLLHASFADFLTDRDRSGEFFFDLDPIHNNLAFASLLQFNMHILADSGRTMFEMHHSTPPGQ